MGFFKSLALSLFLFSSGLAYADLVNPDLSKTPKWSRFQIQYGRTNSEAFDTSAHFNAFSYHNMRGRFQYGAEYSFSLTEKDKLESTLVSFGVRPDWSLEVEPSLNLLFGLAARSGQDPGHGQQVSVEAAFDFFKGPFYSTSVSFRHSHFSLDGQKKQVEAESVIFGVHADFY